MVDHFHKVTGRGLLCATDSVLFRCAQIGALTGSGGPKTGFLGETRGPVSSIREFGLGALVIGVLFAVGLARISDFERESATHIQKQAESQERQTQIAITTCKPLPLLDRLICIGDAFAAQREAERTQEDLKAQQGMVVVAYWVFVFAGIQALIGVGGIFFVARTLDVNSEAVRTAQQAIQAEQRPWLSMNDIRAARITVDANTNTLLVFFSAKVLNIGKTPAMRVALHGEIGPTELPRGTKAEENLDYFCARCQRTAQSGRNVAFFPDENRPPLLETAEWPNFNSSSPPRALRLYVCVTYQSTEDASRVFHTGALVTLDIGPRSLPVLPAQPGREASPIGLITVRDAGNVYSIS